MAKWKEPKDGGGCPFCAAEHDQKGPCSITQLRPIPQENLGVEVQSAVVDGYEPLRRVLYLALQQASGGKGAERHAMGKPFDRQPMLEISRMIGGPQGCLYQAMKKTQEASRMSPDAAKRELLGAINYLAGAYLLLEENEPT